MKILRYITVALTIAALSSCGGRGHEGHDDHEGHEAHEHSDEHDHDHEGHADHEGHDDHDHEGHAADEIILSPEKARAAGVTIDTAAAARFTDVIKCAGRVMPASGAEGTVSATVGGIVRLARGWSEGMPISRGAAVATLTTASLPGGDVSALARSEYERAKEAWERAQALIDDRIITRDEYQAAKAEYDRARLAVEAVGKGGGRGVTVTAPTGGYVKQLLVTDGEYAEVGRPLMTITQNRHLYLRADVPERYYRRLPQVSGARFSTAASDEVYDIDELGGRVVARGRNGSAESSAFVPITFEFDNRADILPDSYAEVYLLSSPREGVVSVPLTALTEEQGVNYVYIRVDEEGYTRREVKTGASDGRRVEIISGLRPGEEYVSSGAIHVKLAGAGKAIPGHTHNH
ncbi:MAG: efflux RND transporter periplasmic adaptor subunit [Pseudoflavonifractor sp.]|nr:efflux RND transporter periplasmic adaptor subunit [Alloprevotella sp.]MCM1117361.1 efflux RND transporter periplasmic adaptor subunit [Pseudoflavonifractor sp.]